MPVEYLELELLVVEQGQLDGLLPLDGLLADYSGRTVGGLEYVSCIMG